ncbi:MAG: DUF5696 domain-containing protein [Defluviitaleaceae bacterium]|nr:DUF5696 domain-containing protein [Defluviitaleaceae bacterium]
MLLLFSLVFLTACASDGVAVDPPAGHIPDWIPVTGAARPIILGESPKILHGHILVAENAHWAMYLCETTLGIIMQDVHTGTYMRSTVAEPDPADNPLWQGLYMSGLTIDVQVGTNVNPTRVNPVNNPHRLNIFYNANGFAAEIFFPGPQIGLTLIVELTESGFTAEVPQASIIENDPNQVIGSLYIYPFLGHTRLGADEGYMFIPDGQGALIKLQDNDRRFATGYAELVFGRNIGLEVEMIFNQFSGYDFADYPEQILMPVFGMVHTERGIGFLGVISSGAENAMLEAWPNGASTAFDWITARFLYRHIFMQPLGLASGTIDARTPRPNRVDAKLTFLFVTGEDANYAGLAVAYRGYLDNAGAFANAAADDFNVGITFLGFEKRDWALFQLNVNMTTFRQAQDMLNELADAGVTGSFVRFEGWMRGGATGGWPNRGFNPAGNIGGRSGLINLRDTVQGLGGELTLIIDPICMLTSARPFESINALRRVTGRTADFSGGNMRRTTPSRTLAISEQTGAAFARHGFRADIMCLPSTLTSYSESGVFFCRTDCAVMYDRSLSHHDAPSLSRPSANTWHHARALTNMPSRGSGYLYVYKDIPFLSIATSGRIPFYMEYVNFQPNRSRFFLNLVETGARPMFLVTHGDAADLRLTNRRSVYTSEFGLYRDQIIRYHRELSAVHARIGDASIVRHYSDDSEVRVYYSNDVRIYINYGRFPAEINGVSVGPMSYVLLEG